MVGIAFDQEQSFFASDEVQILVSFPGEPANIRVSPRLLYASTYKLYN